MRTKTSLIWILLDIAAPQFPSYSGDNIHSRDAWTNGDGNVEDTIPPRSSMHTPPMDMRESTAHYASPPGWVVSRTARAGSPEGPSTQQEDPENSVHQVVMSHREVVGDLAWGPWERLMPIGENSIMDLNWWDLNNF